MKYLLITLLLSTQANANLVKAPACGIGKVCVSEQFTCPIKKPVKAKKKLYKAKKPVKQSVVPVPVVEEKPCEIIQNHYYITENFAPMNRLPRKSFDNAMRPADSYSFNYSPVFYGGGYGWMITKETIRDRFITVPANPVIVPIATPLPSAIWLLGSALGLFVIGRRY